MKRFCSFRALERSDAAAGMTLARLSFDLWRRSVSPEITTAVDVLRDGRKARTLEARSSRAASRWRAARRCFCASTRRRPPRWRPRGRPGRRRARGRATGPATGQAWSPFFTGVDTRVVSGDLLKPGPASAWFNLGRPLVAGEENSPFVHALSAADLAGGISAIVDLRVWTFVNADLTVTFWRTPRPPWILLSAATGGGRIRERASRGASCRMSTARSAPACRRSSSSAGPRPLAPERPRQPHARRAPTASRKSWQAPPRNVEPRLRRRGAQFAANEFAAACHEAGMPVRSLRDAATFDHRSGQPPSM